MAEGSRFGIFPKMFVAMTFVAVVPLGAIWLLDNRALTQRLSVDLDQRLRGQAESTAAAVDAWVDMNLRMARQNAASDAVSSMDAKLQRPILRTIAAEYPWAYLVHTIDLKGMNVARSDAEEPKSYADRLYFKAVAGGAPLGQQVAIGKTSGEPALLLAVPINARGQLAGVFTLATTVKDVTARVTSIHLGRTAFAFLVDADGAVIAHPTARGSLLGHPALVKLGTERSGRVDFKEKDGKEVVAFAQRTALGWTLVVQQDVAEAYAQIADANRNASVLLVATFVLVALVSWLAASRFTAPILNLTKIAEDISRGALDATIAETALTDEIGGLARAIERLRASVKLAMDRLSR